MTSAGPDLRLDGLELSPRTGGCQPQGRSAISQIDSASRSERRRSTTLVDLDPAAARLILDWYALSDIAPRVLDPNQQPILWPEHFDLAILLDNRAYVRRLETTCIRLRTPMSAQMIMTPVPSGTCRSMRSEMPASSVRVGTW